MGSIDVCPLNQYELQIKFKFFYLFSSIFVSPLFTQVLNSLAFTMENFGFAIGNSIDCNPFLLCSVNQSYFPTNFYFSKQLKMALEGLSFLDFHQFLI